MVEVYNDAGISGAKGRNGRPGLDSMLKDASRRKFDVVMAWAIDRLGRSLSDLLDTIQHLEACGVDLYLDQQAIDTTTPMGKLVFQVTGAFAEFERTMIRQRIKAGLKRAVAQGVKLGRPKIDSTTEGAKAACEGCGHLEGGEVARDRDWHGPSHLKRAWLKASTAILPLSPSFLCVAPGCGWIGNGQPHFVLPPNLYKVPPPRGGGCAGADVGGLACR